MEIGSICLFCYIVWGTPISPTKKRSNSIDVSRYQSNATHIPMTCVAKMSTKVTAGGANLQVLRQGAGFAKRCLMVSIQKNMASWGHDPKHGWKHTHVWPVETNNQWRVYIYTIWVPIYKYISHHFNQFLPAKKTCGKWRPKAKRTRPTLSSSFIP